LQKNDENNSEDKQALKSNHNLINPLAQTIKRSTMPITMTKNPERYSLLMNQLKNNLRHSIKLISSKNLKIFDFSDKKPTFVIDQKDFYKDKYKDNVNDNNNNNQNDNNKNTNQMNIEENKIIKSISRNDKKIKNNPLPLQTTQELIRLDNLIQNDDNNKRDDILVNFCYSIIEFFDNKQFNMDRLKPIDFSDIIKNAKETATNSLYKRLSIAEKKEYLKKLNEMKTQQNELKNHRISKILKEGKQVNLIKIKSDLLYIPKLNFNCIFQNEEIYYTKKCIINNWILPPPEFYEKYYIMNENNEEDINNNYNNDIYNMDNKEKELGLK
jgi:hypothetical protein